MDYELFYEKNIPNFYYFLTIERFYWQQIEYKVKFKTIIEKVFSPHISLHFL